MLTFDEDLVGPWVNAKSGWQWVPGSASAIGRLVGGVLKAGITYEKCNGSSVTMHVAGDGLHWINRQLLWTAFDYPFRQLKVRRVLAPVGSANARCVRLVEKLGFTREATLKDAYPGGDLFIYTMAAEDCRWLELKKS